MPYTPEFLESFANQIQALEERRKACVLSELKSILGLEDPKEKGGAYLNDLWAYPFPPKLAFICRLDEDNCKIIFYDIIRL